MKNFPVRPWLRGLLLLSLTIGIGFRFLSLDRKIYWHDEVYTSMRAAGYTRQAIDTALFQNQVLTAPDLQKFQQIKPGSTAADTIASLRQEDPQHPPLYFLMARQWMQGFGGSIAASRLLPALLSLLSLPLMWLLAMELFGDRLTALLATTLLALSPFDVLFAQTARQYGLLTTMVIGSSWLLLRAVRRSDGAAWVGFALLSALGLYTHPFFGLTWLAQGGYMLGVAIWGRDRLFGTRAAGTSRPQTDRLDRNRLLPLLKFSAAVVVALLLYIPWIAVLLDNSSRAAATTDWTRIPVGILYLSKLWLLSFTALFFDLDFGFNNPLTYALRLPFALLIGVAFWQVCRTASRSTAWFLLCTALLPFLVLVLPDLLIGGKRSAVSRYLISCFPAIQLAVARLLAIGLEKRPRVWRWLLALLLTSCVVSLGISASARTWWSKDLSYFNAKVIDLVNAERSPILLSDMGDDYTNMGDLLSLSYGLKPDVRLYLVSQPPDWTQLKATAGDVLVFRASTQLEAAIAQQNWRLEPVSQEARLWRLRR